MRGSDGKQADLYGFGMLVILTSVGLHHTQVAMFVDGWNPVYTAIYALSLSMVFLDMRTAEQATKSELLGGIYSEVLAVPLTWMQLGLIWGVYGLYFWAKRVSYALLVEPEFFAVKQ